MIILIQPMIPSIQRFESNFNCVNYTFDIKSAKKSIMYDALTISNFFITRSREDNTKITPYKIEFLVYFSHGWFMAVDGRLLINEEVKAWRHGPVIESIHKCFKDHKNFDKNIHDGYSDFIKPSVIEFLEGIWSYYGHLNEVEMLSLCLERDTPWDVTYERSSKELVISNELIKRHYKLLHISHPDFCDLDDPISVTA